MSDMVKYRAVSFKRPNSGPVFYHVWHSPLALIGFGDVAGGLKIERLKNVLWF